ncbi:MAG: hypothetical protein H8E27_07535 [Verrucomicrobia subdivision 3 bacterium]|nr:hypothetical protein [Limisphaerales bacterium]
MAELEAAPDSVVEQVHGFLRAIHDDSSASRQPREMPDFLARQKAVFGGRVLADSQATLDDLRAERA